MGNISAIMMDNLSTLPDTVMDPFYKLYNYYLWTLTIADTRVSTWPLMQSPVPTIVISMVYLVIVQKGPKFMSSRQPFNISSILIIYNFAIAILNLYIGVELAIQVHKLKYNWYCEPVNYSSEEDHMRVARALWWYYLSKLIELLDTIFFIMRKKSSQITFLHVYHHSTMFGLWWIGIKWVPGGSSVSGAMLNSFVHVVMYMYYAVSAMGRRYHKYLWWKKYLTILQLMQFLLALVLGVNALFIGCDFPMWMQYGLIMYMISFLILFGNFYAHAYNRRKKSVSQVSHGKTLNGVKKNISNGYTCTGNKKRK